MNNFDKNNNNIINNEKIKSKKEILSKLKLDFYNEIKNLKSEFKSSNQIDGFASGAIVGEKNYPNLKVHSISNNLKENSFFKTADIVKKDYSEIIKLKARNILGSTSNLNVKSFNDRITREISDIYKSKKEVSFSSEFEDDLKFEKIILSKESGVIGANNNLKSLEANENISVSNLIEKYTSSDIKSREAIIELYEKGVNEHQIINLLALGSFGIEINKKLVPTKWAISAYDQIIEKYLFDKIRNYKLIDDYRVFYYENKGNFFLVILFPHFLMGEMQEVMPNKWNGSDFFNNFNKLDKEKPSISGAYWANKVAIFEYLNKIKRQASFLSIRIIDGYDLPLGVVFVRESIRAGMRRESGDVRKEWRGMRFGTKEELDGYLREKFGDFYLCYKNSKLVFEMKKVRKLNDFF